MILKWGIKNVKLLYMDTDKLMPLIKTDDFHEDFANDVEKWFDTSIYDERRRKRITYRKK